VKWGEDLRNENYAGAWEGAALQQQRGLAALLDPMGLDGTYLGAVVAVQCYGLDCNTGMPQPPSGDSGWRLPSPHNSGMRCGWHSPQL